MAILKFKSNKKMVLYPFKQEKSLKKIYKLKVSK